MGNQRIFFNYIHRYSPKKPFTEATATTALSRWLYFGHGEKYLSLSVSDDRIGRSPNAGPRRFRCPTERKEFARWQPLKDHLLGDQKGIVFDAGTTSVPFIAIDIDRHTPSISSKDHQRIVIEAGAFLRTISHVKWLVEVNPRNGSSKFFGFRRSGDHFTRSEAQKLSSGIRQELVRLGLCHNGNIEVFPDNCAAVWLPLRRDKITIVEGGRLPRCIRKTRDYQFFPERVMEEVRVYSALNFLAWIHCGDNYDEDRLASALRLSCRNLPDEVVEVAAATAGDMAKTDRTGKARSPAGSEPADEVLTKVPTEHTPARTKPVKVSTDYDPNEPNAFKRNWSVLLPFAREFFKANGRFPSATNALRYLRDNGLYSGRWEDNAVNRRHRVAAILKKIQETFDPSKLQSNGHVKFDRQVHRWCRNRFPNGLVVRQRQINQMEMSSKIKNFRIPAKFVEHCVGVIAFCLNDHLENQALPTNRIKAVWNLMPGAPSWNQDYFQIVRDELERVGFVNIFDKHHKIGKAWRWRKGPSFPGMKKTRVGGVGGSRRPSTGGAREERSKGIKERSVYNSLYQTGDQNSRSAASLSQIRPPPGRDEPQMAALYHQTCI